MTNCKTTLICDIAIAVGHTFILLCLAIRKVAFLYRSTFDARLHLCDECDHHGKIMELQD